jgi:TPR repeat protein
MKIEFLSRSASQGHTQALFELSKAYYRATGDQKNFPKAIKCLKEAGDLGCIKAYYWLGHTGESTRYLCSQRKIKNVFRNCLL